MWWGLWKVSRIRWGHEVGTLIIGLVPLSEGIHSPMQKMSAPGLGRFSGTGDGTSLQYSLPGKFHGKRSLAGYSPWGRKESDMTEWLSKETAENLFSLYSYAHPKERPCKQTARRQSSEVEISQRNPTVLAPSETSEVQAPELWRNNFLLFKPPHLWYPAVVAQAEIEFGTSEWAAAVTDT